MGDGSKIIARIPPIFVEEGLFLNDYCPKRNFFYPAIFRENLLFFAKCQKMGTQNANISATKVKEEDEGVRD